MITDDVRKSKIGRVTDLELPQQGLSFYGVRQSKIKISLNDNVTE